MYIANLLFGYKSKIKPFQTKIKPKPRVSTKANHRLKPHLLSWVFCQNLRLGIRNENHLIEKKCDRQGSFNYKCQHINLDSCKKNKTRFMAPKVVKSKGQSAFRHSGIQGN